MNRAQLLASSVLYPHVHPLRETLRVFLSDDEIASAGSESQLNDLIARKGVPPFRVKASPMTSYQVEGGVFLEFGDVRH